MPKNLKNPKLFIYVVDKKTQEIREVQSDMFFFEEQLIPDINYPSSYDIWVYLGKVCIWCNNPELSPAADILTGLAFDLDVDG